MSFVATPTAQNLTSSTVSADPYLSLTLDAGRWNINVQLIWDQPSPNDGGFQFGLTASAGTLVWTTPNNGVAQGSGDIVSVLGASDQVATIVGTINSPDSSVTITVMRGQAVTNAVPTVLQANSVLDADLLAANLPGPGSGSYSFAPSVGDLTLNALDRIGIRPPAVDQDIMVNVRLEANFLQLEWQNKGVSLWTVDLVSVPLIQGTATYTVDPTTVMMLDAYIRIYNSGSPPQPTDRFISPISRTDYASQANKIQQGFPTSYWFDRLINPTVTLWPVPDGSAAYILQYYRYRWIQDADYTNGLQPEVPNLFLDAFAAGLAYRLARIYARDLEQIRKADYEEAWKIAATQNTENVTMYISPLVSAYYRI